MNTKPEGHISEADIYADMAQLQKAATRKELKRRIAELETRRHHIGLTIKMVVGVLDEIDYELPRLVDKLDKLGE